MIVRNPGTLNQSFVVLLLSEICACVGRHHHKSTSLFPKIASCKWQWQGVIASPLSLDALPANSSTSATTCLSLVVLDFGYQGIQPTENCKPALGARNHLCLELSILVLSSLTTSHFRLSWSSYKWAKDKVRQTHGEFQVPTPPLHCNPNCLVFLDFTLYILGAHVCVCVGGRCWHIPCPVCEGQKTALES